MACTPNSASRPARNARPTSPCSSSVIPSAMSAVSFGSCALRTSPRPRARRGVEPSPSGLALRLRRRLADSGSGAGAPIGSSPVPGSSRCSPPAGRRRRSPSVPIPWPVRVAPLAAPRSLATLAAAARGRGSARAWGGARPGAPGPAPGPRPACDRRGPVLGSVTTMTSASPTATPAGPAPARLLLRPSCLQPLPTPRVYRAFLVLFERERGCTFGAGGSTSFVVLRRQPPFVPLAAAGRLPGRRPAAVAASRWPASSAGVVALADARAVGHRGRPFFGAGLAAVRRSLRRSGLALASPRPISRSAPTVRHHAACGT